MPRVRRSEQEQRLVDSYGPDFLEVLARGLRIVAAFNAERRQMTLSEVANVVDLPRASVRRALYTLEKLGFVASDGRQFRLTPRILTLATAYLSSNGLSSAAQPVVERVCRKVGESCSAAVLDREDVVFIARASPRRVLSVDLDLGHRLPAFATSLGRVLLGGLDEGALDAHLADFQPTRLTEHTLVDKSVLKATIITAREQGYSFVDQEAELGLRSIAVPVRRYDDVIICSIHIGVHVERVTIGRLIDEFLPCLKEAAADIESMLV